MTNRPLVGKRVLVTRARNQADAAAALFRDRGADPVVMPTIEIHPPSDPSMMIEAVGHIEKRYDWAVLTSINGAERFWAEMERQGKDTAVLANVKVAAIGPGTAAVLERHGVAVALIAKEHLQEGLARELLDAFGGATPRVLLGRAEIARDVLPEALRSAGCSLDVVPLYQTRSPPRELLGSLVKLFENGEIDIVTFTSSSTVGHLCDALESRAAALLAKTCVASIGPATTETAERRGIRVDVTASDSTMSGVVAALEKHFER